MIGNKIASSQNGPAGWGVVVVLGSSPDDPVAEAVYEAYGPVVLDSSEPYYWGAEHGM